jgi:hypothetical protein
MGFEQAQAAVHRSVRTWTFLSNFVLPNPAGPSVGGDSEDLVLLGNEHRATGEIEDA